MRRAARILKTGVRIEQHPDCAELAARSRRVLRKSRRQRPASAGRARSAPPQSGPPIGTLLDGAARHTPEGTEFTRRALEDLGKAIAERDAPFGDYGQER